MSGSLTLNCIGNSDVFKFLVTTEEVTAYFSCFVFVFSTPFIRASDFSAV